MEGSSTSDGYQIAGARIPILLTLKRIRDLKPHEATINEDLDRLTTALRKDPILRHPIITDQATGLVLDGTHRLAALAQLECKLVPCAAIDYQNSSIVLERWFREISEGSLIDFIEKIGPHKTARVTSIEAEQRLMNRSTYASIQDIGSCFVLLNGQKDPMTLARRAFEIEKTARMNGLKVGYSDDKSVPKGANQFLLSTICLSKEEIIAAATSGKVFPPKTTRHIIPSRPLGLGVPIDWLGSNNLENAQKRFTSHLRRLKIRHLPGGTWIGSRRYEEEVFLFE